MLIIVVPSCPLKRVNLAKKQVKSRYFNYFKRMERFEKRLDEQEDELREIKETVIVNSKLITSTERIFWIAVSAGASALMYFLM